MEGKPAKRNRVNFTMRQLEAMETVFAQTQYPDVTVLEMLSEKMQLPVEKVCTWFQNRRSKFRKESKKGHINLMRQQLFTSHPVTAVSTAAAVSTSASENGSYHVLSPQTTTSATVHPTANLHHLPHRTSQTMTSQVIGDFGSYMSPLFSHAQSFEPNHSMTTHGNYYNGCTQALPNYMTSPALNGYMQNGHSYYNYNYNYNQNIGANPSTAQMYWS